MIGPPNQKPSCDWLNGDERRYVTLRSSFSLRVLYVPELWNSFEPLFVTALTRKPVKLPARMSYGDSSTWYSLTASSEICLAPAVPPGCSVELRPNRSFATAPSI